MTRWKDRRKKGPKLPHSAELLLLRRQLRMSGDLLGVALGVNRKTIYRWEVDPTNKEHTRVPIAVILLLRIWVKHPSWIPVTRRHKNRFRPVECFLGPTQRAEPEVASALAEGE